MVEVFRLVRELLRDDGTLWLNIGDSYASGKGTCFNPGGGPMSYIQEKQRYPLDRGNRSTLARSGLKPKDLVGIPWMLAFALRADGWYLRSEIIWHKSNPMPESVTDRPTKSHEQIFLFAKNAKYFYDAIAVKEPTPRSVDEETYARMLKETGENWYPRVGANNKDEGLKHGKKFHGIAPPGGRNRRSVWTIPSAPYRGAHFATYPPALVEPCVLAGTSERGACPQCGAPWERVIEKQNPGHTGETESLYPTGTTANRLALLRQAARENGEEYANRSTTTGWRPTCSCPPAPPVPCVVFDPFLGSGTTAQVAQSLGRNWIGCELNRAYEPMIRERTAQLSILGGAE
jgi:DNA modification methylase